jgi:hypothetical protein
VAVAEGKDLREAAEADGASDSDMAG